MKTRPFVALTDAPLDMASLSRLVESSGYGAVVTFSGNVRGMNRGGNVEYLEYEAYAPLAEKELLRIAETAQGRWSAAVAVAHRLGRIEVGECSIVVAVASAHRAEAFDACRWVMDELKTSAPIWKKEYLADGAHWIEGPSAVPSKATEPRTPSET